MTTVIFGMGYLGRRLAATLPGAALVDADITDHGAVRAALAAHGADAVVNAAGKTGRPNVDWCESHRAETYRANVVGPLVLADECAARGAYLLHIGSGCVFYGPSPDPGGWREDDHANPVSYYSRTKYAADLALAPLPGVGIARIRMPVDAAPHPRNLITKLAAYRQVIDVENSVTVLDDLMVALAALLARRADGVFHVTNPGALRHRALLDAYRRLVDPAHRAEIIGADELVARGLAVVPRSNCILASPRLAALGVRMRPIDEALDDAMQRYALA
jgi:3,5-epimerase/4-reductase